MKSATTRSDLQLSEVSGKLRDLSSSDELTDEERATVRAAWFSINKILRDRSKG